jgi:hypothetical protein
MKHELRQGRTQAAPSSTAAPSVVLFSRVIERQADGFELTIDRG